jgi:hypothetical protein
MRHSVISLLSGLLFWAAVSAAKAPSALDFTWLSGHWCLQTRDGLIEEHWLTPSGNLVIGLGRTVKDGKTVSFEFTRIEVRDGAVDFIALPGGKQETAFRLTASGADWARFENPQHDFPRRVEYRRNGAGLHAEIAGPDGGREVVIPFEYRACPD